MQPSDGGFDIVAFRSFIWGGFEGASHRRVDRQRVDAIEASGHARWATLDHALLRSLGIRTVREALRWHLVEREAGVFDWASARAQIRGALASDTEVIWDLCHWGVPDGVDIMSPSWPGRLARFAAETARMLQREGVRVAGWVPVNEIAFWAWAGGQTGGFAPFLHEQGDAMKRQLILAHMAVVAALRDAGAQQPIIVSEPLVWVIADPADASQRLLASDQLAASLTAIDTILSRDPSAIDVLGMNFYPHNQWRVGGERVLRGDPAYRPLRTLLLAIAQRYQRPLAITETGAEEPDGVEWSDYVGGEIRAACDGGTDIRGVCVYPVADYAGWDNARHCPCGPLGMRDGRRFVRHDHRAALARLSAAAQHCAHGLVPRR